MTRHSGANTAIEPEAVHDKIVNALRILGLAKTRPLHEQLGQLGWKLMSSEWDKLITQIEKSNPLVRSVLLSVFKTRLGNRALIALPRPTGAEVYLVRPEGEVTLLAQETLLLTLKNQPTGPVIALDIVERLIGAFETANRHCGDPRCDNRLLLPASERCDHRLDPIPTCLKELRSLQRSLANAG